MPLNELNSKQFSMAIVVGCQALIRQKLLLNKINVFPVADGDTGDNLSSTASAIIEFSTAQSNLRKTGESVADASIIGARGNSGIIFSQFFNALAKQLPLTETLDFARFANALALAAKEIYSLISNPIKGTMLTLIESWALCSLQQKSSVSFAKAMYALLPLLEQQVEQTTFAIQVLQKANVVDAGALGFYYFVEGFTQFLQQPENTVIYAKSANSLAIKHPQILGAQPEYRYCTEAIIKADSIETSELLHFLKTHGDCALITGNERICRFHVHTNNPRALFTSLFNDYTIQYPKVDDMLRQAETQRTAKQKIALVTDSSAGLPQELLDKHQIHQIPVNIHLDEHHLLDGYSFESKDFYQRLKNFATYPKTSCSNVAYIAEKIAPLASHYNHVIIISIARAMSGTYESFNIVAKNYTNVTVIDSKTYSGAQGLLLHYAAKLIAAKLELATIVNLLHNAIKTTFIFGVINKFESIIRSGRMNKIVGRIAEFSNIKPIISIDADGKGFVLSKCFSKAAAFKKLINIINHKIGKSSMILEEYCIVHADATEQALQLAQITTAAFNQPPIYIEPVSLAIGLHAGHGCIALAVVLRNNFSVKI